MNEKIHVHVQLCMKCFHNKCIVPKPLSLILLYTRLFIPISHKLLILSFPDRPWVPLAKKK